MARVFQKSFRKQKNPKKKLSTENVNSRHKNMSNMDRKEYMKCYYYKRKTIVTLFN